MMLTDRDLAKFLENTITLDESRRDAIINFIEKHQGCTAEDIVEGDKMSGRVKTFRILKDLKKEKLVREEKSNTNKRDK